MANSQITYMDLYGSMWVLDHEIIGDDLIGYTGKDITMRLISGLIPYKEYVDKGYPYEAKRRQMPDNLGYKENNELWDTLHMEKYLIISKHDIIVYNQISRFFGRLSIEDINKAMNDYTVLSVYDNGEYMVFYIYGGY